MTSMMAVAQADPSVIRDAITLNANGTYTVRLYADGDAVDVTVTPEMVLMPDGSPAFAANRRRRRTATSCGRWCWRRRSRSSTATTRTIEGGWPG